MKAKTKATSPPMPAGGYVFLLPGQLKLHPRNMRRVYPAKDVRTIAESIRALGGVLHALQVTPDGASGTYYVVDGNMRLQGARYLGAECPPLKCEIVSQTLAEQKLAMIVSNTMRFEVDPISEALHYQSLRQDEGLSIADIGERTGVSEARIFYRLKLLALDEPIQQLIAEGQLPRDHRAADALLTVPDSAARIKLATKLAEQGASFKTIVAACAKLAEQLSNPRSRVSRAHRNVEDRLQTGKRPHSSTQAKIAPMLAMASPDWPPTHQAAGWPDVRQAAHDMCAACDLKAQSRLSAVAEPAWSLIMNAATDTCDACNIREIAGVCQACPGVQMLRCLIDQARREKEMTSVQHLARPPR